MEHVEDSDVILSLHVDFLDSAVLSYHWGQKAC